MADTDFINIWDHSSCEKQAADGIHSFEDKVTKSFPLPPSPKMETDIVKLAARVVRILFVLYFLQCTYFISSVCYSR